MYCVAIELSSAAGRFARVPASWVEGGMLVWLFDYWLVGWVGVCVRRGLEGGLRSSGMETQGRRRDNESKDEGKHNERD